MADLLRIAKRPGLTHSPAVTLMPAFLFDSVHLCPMYTYVCTPEKAHTCNNFYTHVSIWLIWSESQKHDVIHAHLHWRICLHVCCSLCISAQCTHTCAPLRKHTHVKLICLPIHMADMLGITKTPWDIYPTALMPIPAFQYCSVHFCKLNRHMCTPDQAHTHNNLFALISMKLTCSHS